MFRCVLGFLVCFTRRIVEVQTDPLRRSPSAIDLAPTPRYPLNSPSLLLPLLAFIHLQWLGSRVISVLDSGALGPARVQIAVLTLSGNSLRQTVYARCVSVHQAGKLVAALLRVVG